MCTRAEHLLLQGTAAAAQAAWQHRDACATVDLARTRVAEAEVALSAADAAERVGREALLAAQSRLSEALHIGAALSQHMHEAQAAAAAVAPIHAERAQQAVVAAQVQLGEAQHVVAMAQAEVGARMLLGSCAGFCVGL